MTIAPTIKVLRNLLQAHPENHHVVTPVDAHFVGASDDVHFAYARAQNLIIVAKSPRDFIALHEANPNHSGTLLMYQDNRLSDLKRADIVRAIRNLEAANLPFAGQIYGLNEWLY